MARENTIKVSDREKELLEEARYAEYGTDSVPLGEALEAVCESYLGEMRVDAAEIDD